MSISNRTEQLILTRVKVQKQRDLEVAKKEEIKARLGSRLKYWVDPEFIRAHNEELYLSKQIRAFDVVILYYRTTENDLGACIPDEEQS